MRFRTKVSLLLLALFIGVGVFNVSAQPAEAVADKYSQDSSATEAVKKPVAVDKATNLLKYIQKIKSQIADLQKKLKRAQEGEVDSAKWCHNFKQDLRYGDKGLEVRALQIALKKQGFPEVLRDADRGFRNFTASSVVGFQEKYKKEILAGYGLKHGTGFVGKTTRAKLNKLYGCGVTPVPPVSPIITPIPEIVTPVIPVPPVVGKCTDSDAGIDKIDKYVKGRTCRDFYSIDSSSSAGTSSATRFCRTDRCIDEVSVPGPTKSYVIEYYCRNNKIYSKTLYCENGCENGACKREVSEYGKPYCSAIGSKSEGWYQNGELVEWDNCNGCYAVCKSIGTKSEGWYSEGSCETSGKLIKYDNCGEEQEE